MPGRRLDIRKRLTLEGVSSGWTSACYIEYVPATVSELRQFQSLRTDNLDEEKATERLIDFAKEHIVGGKGLIMNDDGTSTLQDLSPDDADIFPVETLQRLFGALTGAQYADPKVSTTEPSSETPLA